MANIVNLKYRDKDLTDKEIEIGMSVAASKNPDFLPLLVNFKAAVAPFQQFMFHDNIVQTIKPCDWWKSHKDHVNQELLEVVDQLLTAVTSSAGVERILSSFGLVHSNIRNQLGIEKAGKLVFLFKLFNQKALESINLLD